MKIQSKKESHDEIEMSMSLNQEKNFQGLEKNDFKSGLAVISGVIKSGKINITEACKNLGPKKPGC